MRKHALNSAGVLVFAALLLVGCMDFFSPVPNDNEQLGAILIGYAYNLGGENTDIEITLEPVVAAQSRSVVMELSTNATARSLPEELATWAAEDGYYEFSGVPDGRYIAHASTRDGCLHAFHRNIIMKNDTKIIVIPVIILGPVGNISGNAAFEDEITHDGIMVYAAGTSYIAMTDADGNYTITNVPEGDDYMVMFAVGQHLAPYPDLVSVTAGETSELANVVLDPNSTEPDEATSWHIGNGEPGSELGEQGDLYLDIDSGDVYEKTTEGWQYLMNLTGPQGPAGEDGEDGADGADGVSISWQGTFTSHPENPELNWAYYNSTDGKSYIYDGAQWQILAQDGVSGTDGADGLDGVSVQWQGTFESHPENPQLNWAYYNSAEGISYVYDGSTWHVLAMDGEDAEMPIEIVDKLLASDGAAWDEFGCTVAISENYAIVGAEGDDDNGYSSGSAYIFERTGLSWNQAVKLTPADGAEGDRFGAAVAISGSYAIVGAYWNDGNEAASGSAYIFERGNYGNWSQAAKLTPEDGAGGDHFGEAVAISGDYAIIGALFDDDNGYESGSAYIFERDVDGYWVQAAKLTPADGAADDRFGAAVAVSGDYAIVGAYGDDDYGSRSGSAYVFERTGGSWNQVAKLTPADGAASDEFATSVAISGNYAIAGAHYHDDNEINSGSAYVFERADGNWSQAAKLTAGDGALNDYFGIAVAISGSCAIVGASFDDDNGPNSGSAYVFERGSYGSWTQTAKLIPADGAGGDSFGGAVAISENYAIVAASTDDDNGEVSGSAYIVKQ
jgi:hypothetical protein